MGERKSRQKTAPPLEGVDGLTMTPESMRRLANAATEALIERVAGLNDAKAWDGEFREVLKDRLGSLPPEDGRPAEEVLTQVVREVLPFAARLDHPRFFWLRAVVAHLAQGNGGLFGRRIQYQLVDLARVERHQPVGAGRRGLAARLDWLSGHCWRAADQRRLERQPDTRIAPRFT